MMEILQALLGDEDNTTAQIHDVHHRRRFWQRLHRMNIHDDTVTFLPPRHEVSPSNRLPVSALLKAAGEGLQDGESC